MDLSLITHGCVPPLAAMPREVTGPANLPSGPLASDPSRKDLQMGGPPVQGGVH